MCRCASGGREGEVRSKLKEMREGKGMKEKKEKKEKIHPSSMERI